MAASAIKHARLSQVGEEVTRGTAVAATRRLLTKDLTYRVMEDLEAFEGQQHGTLSRTVTPPVPVRNGVEIQYENNLDFEQLLLFLLSGLKGAVTPSTPGSGEARLWTFTPVNADPVPDTYTFEFADRDLASTPNEIGLEAPYCFTTELSITGAVDGVPQVSASMVGRKVSSVTVTPALALPSVSYAGNLRWAIYVDESWANLGTTKVAAQIYGFTWTLSNLLYPAHYLEDRSTLDFAQYEYRPKVVDLTMDFAIEPSAGLLVNANEPTDKAAGTKRFVRIEITGGAFDSPDDGLNRLVTIDGSYVHQPDSLQDRGEDRDSAAIAHIHLMNAYDSTQGDDITVTVQNNLATFP